jgi:hypothetical protein
MCDAVVVPRRPAKLTSTSIVFAVVLKITVANPVPGLAVGGTSLAPFRGALKVIVPAFTVDPKISAAQIISTVFFIYPFPRAGIIPRRTAESYAAAPAG